MRRHDPATRHSQPLGRGRAGREAAFAGHASGVGSACPVGSVAPARGTRRGPRPATGDVDGASSSAASGATACGTADFPAVGDWLALEPVDDGRGGAAGRPAADERVRARRPERGGGRAAHEQVLAANVDTVVIVAALDPRPQPAPPGALPGARLGERRGPGHAAQQGGPVRRPRRHASPRSHGDRGRAPVLVVERTYAATGSTALDA